MLTVEQSVASRTSFGGTAPDNVARAVAAARKRFLAGSRDERASTRRSPRSRRCSRSLALPLAACGKKGAPRAAAGRAQHLSAELSQVSEDAADCAGAPDFAYRDGALHAEDVPLARIAAAVGTPVYCYSSGADRAPVPALRRRLRRPRRR